MSNKRSSGQRGRAAWQRGALIAACFAASVAAGGLIAGCDDESPSDDDEHMVGQVNALNTWEPTVPSSPVDPAEVQKKYAATLAAVVGLEPSVAWSKPTVRTQRFSLVNTTQGYCTVIVEQEAADYPALPSAAGDLLAQLKPVATEHGFPDLNWENDPGGAIRFVSVNDEGALLEFRSKQRTTAAVFVVTADSDCD